MSLDIAILSDDGRPLQSISLKPDQHFKLFGTLDRAIFPLLARLSDYYKDADFSLSELVGLKQELGLLLERLQQNEDAAIVNSLTQLAQEALSQGKDLTVIAD